MQENDSPAFCCVCNKKRPHPVTRWGHFLLVSLQAVEHHTLPTVHSGILHCRYDLWSWKLRLLDIRIEFQYGNLRIELLRQDLLPYHQIGHLLQLN